MPSPSSSPARVVILGGGYAGVLAANRIAGRLGRLAQVTLVSDRDELVHRIRLHEALAGHDFKRYPLRRLLRRRIEIVVGRALRVDAMARVIELAAGEPLRYDQLLITLGSGVDLSTPGAREHGGALASIDSALAAAERIDDLPAGASIVVVGGGLTGIEAATEIAEAHPRLAVTLLAPSLSAGVSERGHEHIRAVAAGLGVTIREAARVAAVAADAVVLADGERLPSALTIWAAGFSASPLGAASALPINPRGQIVVDGELRVAGHDGIFAAGDGAAPPPGMDDFLRMGCASAMPMAAHAADNLVAQVQGQPLAPHRFAFFISCISLGRRNGLIQGLDARDRPSGRVITGRLAALMKDVVCRYVIGGLRVERRVAGAYRWPSAIRALPAAEHPALTTGAILRS